MRREFETNAQLTEKQIEHIWKSIYDENPSIKRALESARGQYGVVQEYINSIFKGSKKGLGQEILNTQAAKDRLYKYWKEAGLEGTPEQIFNEYLQQHSEEYLAFEEYDYSKPAWDKDQSRVARNNMLITLMQERLKDPQTIRERTTPGGFENAMKAAEYLKDLLGIANINYDYSDPWTMVVYNQQNQVAGKLIGIFANQNANHAIASLMKRFELVQPIAFGDHPHGLYNLLNPNALTKELLAASVDAVKSPALNFLNLNTITADSAGMLCRLGYSFEEIGLLMNQPIIKDLCRYCMDNNMSDIDTAINNLLQDWGAKGDYANIHTSSLTVQVLEKGITDFRDNPNIRKENQDFINTQAQVLELFRTIYATAKDVSSFVTNTKFTAANAVKSTFGGMYAQQDKVYRYVNSLKSATNPRLHMEVSDYTDSPIELGLNMHNVDEYMSEILNNPFGYEQVMYDTNVMAIEELGRYYPYNNPTYKNVRLFMTDLTKFGLDEDTINQIHEHMLRYMVSLDKHSLFNPEFPIELDNGETVSAIDYFTGYVPIKISNLLKENPLLKTLPIFNHLIFEEDENGNVYMKLDDSGALTPTQKEEIRDSWEILLTDPALRTVARDIYMYSFYKDGFGFGVIGFNHLAPLELKLQLSINGDYTYIDFLNKVLGDLIQVNPASFARSFIESHKDNTRLVYEPKSKQYNYIHGLVYPNNISVDSFELDYSKNNNKVKPFILRTTKKTVHFKPAILIDGLLYIADGDRFNVSTNNVMRYRLVKDRSAIKIDPASIAPVKENPEDKTMQPKESQEGPQSNNIFGNNQNQPSSEGQSDSSSTSIDGEPIVEIRATSIDELVHEVVRAAIKSNNIQAEHYNDAVIAIQQNLQTLSSLEEKNEALVEQLKTEYKKAGVTCKLNGKKIC